MAAPQNHWKLGLFVVAGLALALAAVAVLGARSMQQDVGLYVSFFDESVQGLEVGSPIKFRGVTIGAVGRIDVALDRRHVEVESHLFLDQLARLGLDIAKGPARRGAVPKLEQTADLRLQLASAGLTGVKFLQLDFFDVGAFPPPELPFPVPRRYIPTAPSMMKNLEDSLTRVMNRLPEITDQITSILGEVEGVVQEVRDQRLPERIANALDTADGVLAAAEEKIRLVDTVGLSRSAKRTLAGVTGAVARLDGLLVRVDGETGLLSNAERVSASLGDALRDADGLGGQLIDTLGSVQEAARSLRRFTEALEQDPDMLLKGRGQEVRR